MAIDCICQRISDLICCRTVYLAEQSRMVRHPREIP